MAYADYSYYTDTYQGRAVPSSIFDSVAERASEVLDALTFGRIDTPTEAIKKACCAISERVFCVERRGGSDVAEERTGSHSIAYINKSMRSEMMEYRKIANIYMGNTGLLYRGACLDDN